MTCQESRHVLVDRARGGSLDADAATRLDEHLEMCAACREAVRREAALTRDLRALAAGAAGEEGDPQLEGRLLSAFEAHLDASQPARGHAWTRHARAAAAAVAVMAGAALALIDWREQISPQSGAELPAPGSALADEGALDGFVVLPTAAGLPAFESGQIVRVEVPVASLPAYGIDMLPGTMSADVPADVLIGQDGLPRAIRLVDSDSDP